MNHEYHELMKNIQVPKELEDRVLRAAWKQQRTDTGRRAGRHWKMALRGAVCAACALALVLGTVTFRPKQEPSDGEQSAGVLSGFTYAFGLTAYAADTGETFLPNANGGLAILSGAGLMDPEWGGFTGSLFQVNGEDIQTVSLSINKGGLYRNRLHTGLTEEERLDFYRKMEEHVLPPVSISRDETGMWYLPELEPLGDSVTEDYDPEAQYGFWIPPEELVTEDGLDGPDYVHANVDFFDGAVLTVSVTMKDGTSQTKDYQLSAGKLKVTWEADGTCRMLPQLAGSEEPYLYGIYAADQEQSRWFAWPVEGSRTVSLSNPYGARANPGGQEETFHTGIDIPAPEGEAVLAAAGGTVIETGFDTVRGNYLLLDHGNGLSTLYGQCRNLTAEKGDAVKAGEMLGAVGSTGMSTGPHLHFEVRQDEQPQDPVAYFDSTVRETLTMQ